MKFVCYSTWEELPTSANLLFEQAEKTNVFFSRAWFENVTASLNDDHALLLACVMEGEKVQALLPLMTSGNNKTWYSLRHGFTAHYSLLLAEDAQGSVIAYLAESLSQLPVNGVLLEPVATDDENLNQLREQLEARGFRCEYLFRNYNWVYPLQGQSYAEYMAARPTQLRNTIARKQRKLEREQGYTIRLFTGDDVPAHMGDYYVVYNASWKQNEERYLDFQDDFIADFSKAGWTRLAVLYVNEQAVAAQLWFVYHGTASIFRLAYDKGWRKYSVGSILTSFLMEYAIDTDKVQEIDFLTGNDAYKQDWMSLRRERFLLSCVKQQRSMSQYERLIEWFKRILNK